jgi:serine/threonine-protein kinase
VRSGEKIGEWELEELLGAGAFGEVWRARAIAGGRRAALKLPRDERGAALLRREGSAQAKLASPRFPRVLGVHLDEPCYVAFELIDGESLRAVIADRGPLAVPEAVHVALEVLRALEDAHKAGLVHRDLKPENVLVARDGRVLVTDLGLAILPELASSLADDDAVAAAGSAPYLAPESRGGGALDARADVYAWGVLLFECLAGALPAAAEAPSSRPGVPRALDAVYARACARREARFASAAEARADLERVARSAGIAPRPLGAAKAPEPEVKTDVKALLERVASEEKAFLERDFTAFVTPDGRAYARMKGKTWVFDVAGAAPGLCVLRATSPTAARIVRRLTRFE